MYSPPDVQSSYCPVLQVSSPPSVQSSQCQILLVSSPPGVQSSWRAVLKVSSPPGVQSSRCPGLLVGSSRRVPPGGLLLVQSSRFQSFLSSWWVPPGLHSSWCPVLPMSSPPGVQSSWCPVLPDCVNVLPTLVESRYQAFLPAAPCAVEWALSDNDHQCSGTQHCTFSH